MIKHFMVKHLVWLHSYKTSVIFNESCLTRMTFFIYMFYFCSVLVKYCYMKVKIKKQSFANLFLFKNYVNRTVMSIK